MEEISGSWGRMSIHHRWSFRILPVTGRGCNLVAEAQKFRTLVMRESWHKMAGKALTQVHVHHSFASLKDGVAETHNASSHGRFNTRGQRQSRICTKHHQCSICTLWQELTLRIIQAGIRWRPSTTKHYQQPNPVLPRKPPMSSIMC
ncbi:hypothetical protein AVEN_257625-1 [Araneus ventricosus]|uniref:Uncharacterized protein n=1 Tax=Araneus ventricosus TaxID=182803 RepID=A0A4Y2E3I3_ARAVE|nr:hypothetical protein AVEN_257625-1 [Araneus ventricosus]